MVRRKKNTSHRRRRSKQKLGKPNRTRDLKLEMLEDRMLLAADFQLASVQTNASELLTPGERLTTSPSELTLVFSKGAGVDLNTVGGIEIVRSGFDGVFDNENDVTVSLGYVGAGSETNEIVVRFAQPLVDDAYRIQLPGTLMNDCGSALNDGTAQSIPFEIDLGARVVAVVPQPVTISSGRYVQSRNQIDVYFNDDDLITSAAENPLFYQLIFTNDTATNTDDSAPINPTGVQYSAAEDKVTLTFDTDIENLTPGAGTYRLRIGSTEFRASAPVDVTPSDRSDAGATTSSADSSFGTLSRTPKLIEGNINANAAVTGLTYPGSEDDPGHRLVSTTVSQHVTYSTVRDGNSFPSTFEDRTPDSIDTISYNFRSVYGHDFNNNVPITNQITEIQKTRAREVLQLYSYYTGVQFVETSVDGFTIATGDIRGVSGPFGGAGFSFTAESGVAGTSTIVDGDETFTIPVAVVNGADQWDVQFGESWFRQAMKEIGHLLGFGESNDLPDGTIFGSEESFFGFLPQENLGRAPEDVFPSADDITHGQFIFHDNSNDVDLYSFSVTESGVFSAETFAQRADNASSLDTVLRLFAQSPSGPVPIAQNDDYFGTDSQLELELSAGQYYIGVSSTGNDDYHALFESGANGTSSGNYQLRVEFLPSSSGGLIDTTGIPLDGDSDGLPGGDYNFWFRAADEADTLFVDDGATGGDGRIASPLGTISAAMAQATPGSIVRVLGNFADDGQENTYGIGFDNLGSPLEDGGLDGLLRVRQDVVLMIDAGAVFKMRRGSILVGSDSSVVDRSGGSIQVLGTPDNQVIFTSVNDTSVGVDIDPLTLPANRGDWGGILVRRDVDDAAGFRNYENDGIFLDYINNSEIMFGGGVTPLGSVSQVINPITLIDARMTISENTLTFNADAAIAASPNSFRETNFRAPEFQSTPFTPDYRRIGPKIYGNTLLDNSTNGLFIVDRGSVSDDLVMEVSGRWDDTDIVHVLSDSLILNASTGGILQNDAGIGIGRLAGSLVVDPGTVVKSESGRIELGIGASMIAEGTEDLPIIFTSLQDMRYGAGGTFVTNRSTSNSAEAGDWAGIMARPISSLSMDHTVVAYAGGVAKIEGGFTAFNPIEVHQADARIVHSTFEFNQSGSLATITTSRVGRGENEPGTIYVRGAQPIVLDNVFHDNAGAVININVDSLNYLNVTDTGRQTGSVDLNLTHIANQGPLIRENILDSNGVNGMVVRGGTLGTESVWDDTDIVHVLYDNVFVPNLHSFGGLRLKSSPTQSLVIKALGEEAGFVTTGKAIGIPDHIGGSMQVLGQPGNPVIMTSLFDDTVGAGTDLSGRTQVDTDGGGRPIRTVAPGQEGSFQLDVNFGPNIRQFPEVMDAFRFAADIWEENLQDPISVSIDVDLTTVEDDMGLTDFPGAGVLTELNANNFDTFNLFTTTPVLTALDYANVRNAMINDAGDHEAVVKQLPTELNVELPQGTTDFEFDNNMILTRANASALSLGVSSVVVPSAFDSEVDAIDGTILINDNLDLFDFDRTDGLKNYREDFQTKILAEIGSILGFETGLDQVIGALENATGEPGDPVDVALTPLDLFRLAPGEGQEDFANSARRMDPRQEDHVFYAGGELDYRGYPFEGITIGDIPLGTGYDFGRDTDELNDIFANRWRDDQFFRDGIRYSFDTIGVMDQTSRLRDEIINTYDSTVTTQGMVINISEADRLAFDSIGWDVVGGAPGDWQGIRVEELSYDGNVEFVAEAEADADTNRLPATAQPLGQLAENRNAGNEELRLGFEIHGKLSTSTDVDVYSFAATAGTDVWIDIDQSANTLDTIVELIGSDGSVLASSDSSLGDTASGGFTGLAEPLGTVDRFSINELDAGMKVNLPGPQGLTSNYFVQVRTPQSASSGRYELQVRLRGRDEVPGTSVQFADIRYAETGVKIVGPPSDSPLIGEQSETESINDYFTEYTVYKVSDSEDPADRYAELDTTVSGRALPFDVNAQLLGNIAATRQGAISVNGSLQHDILYGSESRDVDWYEFIVAPGDRTDGTVDVVFDIDYASGLGGPDTVLAVYDRSLALVNSPLTPTSRKLTADLVPTLLYYSDGSSIAGDMANQIGTSDVITGGSFGSDDPFIGPVSLDIGQYFVAVSSIADIPGRVADAISSGADIFSNAVPGDSNRGLAVDPSAPGAGSVPIHSPNPNAPFNATTEGEYQLEIRIVPDAGAISSVSVDENRERIQGQIVISNNSITDSRTFGISVEDAPREQRVYGGVLGDLDFNSINFRRSSSYRRTQNGQFNISDWGSNNAPRALPGLNEQRVVPGITIANNVIARGFDGGINLQGDPDGIVLDIFNVGSLFEWDDEETNDYESGNLDGAQFSVWDYQGNVQEFQFTSSGTSDPGKIPIRFNEAADDDPGVVNNELFNNNINPPTTATNVANEILHALRLSDLDITAYKAEGRESRNSFLNWEGTDGAGGSEDFQTGEEDVETFSYDIATQIFIEGAMKIGMPDVISDTIKFAFNPTFTNVFGNVPPINAHIVQQSAVTYARIVNNTVVGRGGDLFDGNGIDDVGIVIEDNASPTLLNNIISNFATGIRSDLSANDSNELRRTFIGTEAAIAQSAFVQTSYIVSEAPLLQSAGFGTGYLDYRGLSRNPDAEDSLDVAGRHRDVRNSPTVYLGARPTIIGASVYQGNLNDSLNIGAGDDAFALDNSAPLFVDAFSGNYFLADGSRAIDSSTNSLPERAYLTDLLSSAGISTTGIVAPDIDAIGILRVDDPNVSSPPGSGSNVFKDRGALERADFVGPMAILTGPEDNGLIDDNPQLNSVTTLGQVVTFFEVKLSDGATLANPVFGSGIDDTTVQGAAIMVRRDGTDLVDGVDYTLTYDATNDTLRIVPIAGIWIDAEYEIELLNDPETGIRDKTGNALRANQADGRTLLTIDIGTGTDFGDAPAPYPTRLADDGAVHDFSPGFYLGGNVTIEFDANVNGDATADGSDDGVQLPARFTKGAIASVPITASAAGYVNAWIDWNVDGVWSSDEQVLRGAAVTAGVTDLTIQVPADAEPTSTFARFRFSSEEILGPTGLASNGEVEDYLVTVGINPWQNPDNRLDVLNDGNVAPADALAVVNELNESVISDPSTGLLPATALAGQVPPYLDVNGDGFVSPIDALLVINALGRPTPAAALSARAPAIDILASGFNRQDDEDTHEILNGELSDLFDELAEDVSQVWSGKR